MLDPTMEIEQEAPSIVPSDHSLPQENSGSDNAGVNVITTLQQVADTSAVDKVPDDTHSPSTNVLATTADNGLDMDRNDSAHIIFGSSDDKSAAKDSMSAPLEDNMKRALPARSVDKDVTQNRHHGKNNASVDSTMEENVSVDDENDLSSDEMDTPYATPASGMSVPASPKFEHRVLPLETAMKRDGILQDQSTARVKSSEPSLAHGAETSNLTIDGSTTPSSLQAGSELARSTQTRKLNAENFVPPPLFEPPFDNRTNSQASAQGTQSDARDTNTPVLDSEDLQVDLDKMDYSMDDEAGRFASLQDNDLLTRVKGLYRLLELYSEEGSGGLVDKVIIAQDSLRRLVEHLSPGAYLSMTKIDFRALDDLSLKPIGVYGSQSMITSLLRRLNVIDDETAAALLASASLSEPNGKATLRSGIYILIGPGDRDPSRRHAYVIYWPEPTTWDDNAISAVKRNRVTFLRYLTKLTDQVVALLSPEHADAIVWNNESDSASDIDDDIDGDEDRLFTFEVQKTKEEEESVAVFPGFSHTIARLRPPSLTRHKDGEVITDAPRLIAGEARQGLLNLIQVPARISEYTKTEVMKEVALTSLIKDHSRALKLGNEITQQHLELLIHSGLRSRYPSQLATWDAGFREANSIRDADIARGNKDIHEAYRADLGRLKKHLKEQLSKTAVELYPMFEDKLGKPAAKEVESNESLSPLPQGLHELTALDSMTMRSKLKLDDDLNFRALKKRLLVAGGAVQQLEHQHPSADFDALDTAVMTGKAFSSSIKLFLKAGGQEYSGMRVIRGLYSAGKSLFGNGPGDDDPLQGLLNSSATVPAQTFLPTLFDEPYSTRLSRSVDKVTRLAIELLTQIIDKESENLAHRLSANQIEAVLRGTKERLTAQCTAKTNDLFISLKNGINGTGVERSVSSGNVVTLHSVVDMNHDISAWRYTTQEYRVCLTRTKSVPEHINCALRFLSLTAEDKQAVSMDRNVVPKPISQSEVGVKFSVPTRSSLRHIQLFENGKILVFIDIDSKTRIYLEDEAQISSAIEYDRSKRQIDITRVGEDFLITVNESKRLLVILSRVDNRLHVFGIDEQFTNIHERGSAVDLRPWLPPEPHISQICFVSGSEEVFVFEDSGSARVFSLLTEQFKPAALEFIEPPSRVFSTPDGSCLITISQSTEGLTTLRAFHWSTFGMNTTGIVHILPGGDWMQCCVTSVVSRSNMYIATVDPVSSRVESVRLSITNKTSEYTFRSQGRDRPKHGTVTKHNCLVDCLADVWTRYPVIAAIPRISPASMRFTQAILFIADAQHEQYRQHFRNLIRSYERNTRKPTGGLLDKMHISADSFEAFLSSMAFEKCSVYPAGKWIVELICLIPIHLAIANGNRFIPLKDGVSSSDFERSLLGADVLQIANSITIGWYESVFQSYMATKPVKVVSSMGEQSVGKSYALNHFVDTSFAGSAMRCTEGVWLSVTPTETHLIVALDFEGIHSIERSAQEDMLLVLFNAALSNLVLFRNNFALSRDIAGLFTSFQSSTSQLDPASNPMLFQSTLAIIIKDVVDSDSREIVKEFSLKFQKIVQDEQEGNFITKLHKGKLDIIPWPVIESTRFYTLMTTTLKKRLDAQKESHGNAYMFLQILKTLMAKLKASDWGALDHNLASQRAQTLLEMLPNALAYGVSEVDALDGALRNLDSNDIITNDDSEAIFDKEYISIGRSSNRESYLLSLCRTSPFYSERHNSPESAWTFALATFLQQLAQRRVVHVRNWIDVNISRFPTEHADVQTLRRQFDRLARELTSSVELCAMKCASCGLRCLQGKRHDGEHHCTTDHLCLYRCEMDTSNCGFLAGHDGRHICDVGLHLCGEPCHLRNRGGCQNVCDKPLDHPDEDHICSARLHACGEPCHLSAHEDGGKYLCTSPCVIDYRESHDRHICENRLTCPAKCQLCSRLCAVADHFHALANGAIHLCGQEHPCEELCSLAGICEIATSPRSVESTFVGRKEVFQFTKYTQVANRLRCIIPIPPNKVSHQGRHVHSTADKPFHFCETRCPSCKYFCTLPLGHSQEHETSHGSMEETTWAIDGDDDAVQEIQGRKFSTGDSGAPMLCNIVCGELGRHAHIDFCRAPSRDACLDHDVEHIFRPMLPDTARDKDWITHSLYWARSGFKDPYSREEQTEYTKCDYLCPGDEHKETESAAAQPSHCVLPIFHPPAVAVAAERTSHVSSDGHEFRCKNPALQHAAFHVIFVLDRSSSMTYNDRQPLAHHPANALISRHCNNRYGAVLSALYSFWSARQVAAAQAGAMRRDAYSAVLLGSTASTAFSNDFSSSPDELLNPLLDVPLNQGTNYRSAIKEAQQLLVGNWSSQRLPVLIFLSDGECGLPEVEMYDLCRRSVALGHPLSFHSVSFGREDNTRTSTLRRMADIAQEVHNGAASVQRNAGIPSGFTNAIDTIQLAQTFLGISESMRKVRGSLIRS